ncbi:hypothetical protein [Paenibacillus silvisoli]|uniref:hypothetical protein n=1 Tax=Paenibacillus silvisoli TaxID=3110539 RepID=UPI002804E56D|nr:hypothetical protein [Paenibacillus silvisoli]
MKFIINERELKEYFDGLARLLVQRKAEQPPSSDPLDMSELVTFQLTGKQVE